MTEKKEKKTVQSALAKIPAKKSSATIETGEKRLRLATEKHPTIEAIITDLFRFETKEQAETRIKAIKEHFIISAKLPKDSRDSNVLKLWIRGYMISDDEEKQGYLGNYAAFRVVQLKDKKFTIRAEKQNIALKYHPQRKRPKRKHPDWGHPALRLVKKGEIFETLEEANKLLKQLHTEYPDISIPAINKLFIILYSKADNPEKPVQKYILEVKPSRDGGFHIDYRLNDYQKKQLPVKKVRRNEDVEKLQNDNQQAGYFTSMITLKRDKKSKISDLRKKKQEGDK
ncbi:MAG TPA: hypothetical protein DIV86_02155 [Alphaproteobacteria bacterium]|nr:hypothetical protein [Alphaproteobacteria bacterium]